MLSATSLRRWEPSRTSLSRSQFFDKISTQIPTEWHQGAMDADCNSERDGKRMVIKAVNYGARRNTLLVRLQGKKPAATGKHEAVHDRAKPNATASFEHPAAFVPVSQIHGVCAELSLRYGSVFRGRRGDSSGVRPHHTVPVFRDGYVPSRL